MRSSAVSTEIFGPLAGPVRENPVLIHIAAYAKYFKALFFAVFTALAVSTISVRLNWIFNQEFPPATDSYFYLQEIAYRLQYGRGYYVSFSPFFFIFTLAAKLLRFSPEQTLNVVVVLSLIVFSIASVLFISGRGLWWIMPSVVYSLWASELLFYRHYAFPRQAFAVASIAFGAALVLLARHRVKSTRVASYIYIAGWLAIILGALSHLSATAVALVVLSSFIFTRKFFFLAFLPGLLLGTVLADFFKIREIFSAAPFTSAWGLFGACEYSACSMLEWSEVYLASAALVLVGLWGIFAKTKDNLFWFTCAAVLTLNLPIWHAESHMSHRLALLSLWLLPIWLMYTLQIPGECRLFRLLIAMFVVISGVTAFNNFKWEGRSYKGIDFPSQTLFEHKDALKQWISKDAFILAKHGLQFRMTYFLQRSSGSKYPVNDTYSGHFELMRNLNRATECHVLTNLSSAIPHDRNCVSLDANWKLIRR